MKFNLCGIDISINKGIVFVFAVLLALTLGFAGYLAAEGNEKIVIETGNEQTKALKKQNEANSQENNINNTAEAAAPAVAVIQAPVEQIMVYVVGCVNKPGIVKLEKGKVIDDAIKAAGGTAKDADLENINLVYKLEENVMLKILPKKTVKAAGGVKSPAVGSTGQAGSGAAVVKDSGTAAVISNSSQESKAAAKVNINTAAVEQLDTLPYIGVETAKDIIAYREKNGPFKTINDIMKVTGIKESRFTRIKDLITVN
jgi:competence protein ComEA